MPLLLPSATLLPSRSSGFGRDVERKPIVVAQSSKCFEGSTPRVCWEHIGEEFNVAWSKGKKAQENYSQ